MSDIVPKEELAKLPFMDSQLDVEKRVADLLGRLTIDEKLSLCAGEKSFGVLFGKGFYATKAVPRLGVSRFKMTDGPHGLGALGSRYKKATYFPVGICRTATWNPALAEQFGINYAHEVRDIGYHMTLGPAINIDRTPLCGRNFEYQTEDPYLNKKMTVPIVKGTQSQRVAVCLKHFAANNQETDRRTVSAEVSERALREIYLPGYEAAVKDADAWSVMGCYNKINGVYGCEHPDLLTTKLRKEWGFRGFVVSDWFALRPTTSAESCLKAGTDLEMPGPGTKYRWKRLRKIYKQGKLTEQDINKNVSSLLRVMFFTGIFDDPAALPKGSRNTPEHWAVARKIADEGIVLLKNAGDLLPLDITKVKSIAVLGPNANKKRGQGGGSSMIRPIYETTPLQGLKEKCTGKVRLISAPAKADVAIVVVGLYHSSRNKWDVEGSDKKELELPAKQVQLIQQTVQQNPKTIVVLINGSPVAMDQWLDKVPAVIEAWYAGMEGGRALADILFGDVNPSGKLPQTFSKKLADCPAHASKRTYPGENGKVYYEEDILVGYRYFDTKGIEPLFPFGHGLSYTTFKYENLRVSGSTPIGVSVDITNTGSRAGAEVVQLYVQDVEASVPRPLKELKGFQKVRLDPGQKTAVKFELKTEDLAFYSEKDHQWVTEPGKFVLHVGSSSRDIRLQAEFEKA
jgi:beta-glucosidase